MEQKIFVVQNVLMTFPHNSSLLAVYMGREREGDGRREAKGGEG